MLFDFELKSERKKFIDIRKKKEKKNQFEMRPQGITLWSCIPPSPNDCATRIPYMLQPQLL